MEPGLRQAIGDSITFHPVVRIVHLGNLSGRKIDKLGVILDSFFLDALGNDSHSALHNPRQKDVGDGAVVSFGDTSKHFVIKAWTRGVVGERTERNQSLIKQGQGGQSIA